MSELIEYLGLPAVPGNIEHLIRWQITHEVQLQGFDGAEIIEVLSQRMLYFLVRLHRSIKYCSEWYGMAMAPALNHNYSLLNRKKTDDQESDTEPLAEIGAQAQ